MSRGEEAGDITSLPVGLERSTLERTDVATCDAVTVPVSRTGHAALIAIEGGRGARELRDVDGRTTRQQCVRG
jgi:hypothetical protein